MKGIRIFELNHSCIDDIVNPDQFDIWGFAELIDSKHGIGAEYNYSCDYGINQSAIYPIHKYNEKWTTDYDTFSHYEINFDEPDWEIKLEKAMNDFLDEIYGFKLEKEDFINTLNEFEIAFEKLANLAYDSRIPSEWWNGEDNYPFDKAVEDLIIPIHEWVNSCKRVVNGAAIKWKYTVVAYLSDIVPEYNGDDNLVQMDVRGEDLYQWYIVQMIDKGDCSVEAFTKWCEEHTADDTVGLYNDLKGNKCISNVYICS